MSLTLSACRQCAPLGNQTLRRPSSTLVDALHFSMWRSHRPRAARGRARSGARRRHRAIGFLARRSGKRKRSLPDKLTCTLDSGRLIFMATSSRIKMSGYFVLLNSCSSTSNCARVKVVLSRRCFLGLPLTRNLSYNRIRVETFIRVCSRKPFPR